MPCSFCFLVCSFSSVRLCHPRAVKKVEATTHPHWRVGGWVLVVGGWVEAMGFLRWAFWFSSNTHDGLAPFPPTPLGSLLQFGIRSPLFEPGQTGLLPRRPKGGSRTRVGNTVVLYYWIRTKRIFPARRLQEASGGFRRPPFLPPSRAHKNRLQLQSHGCNLAGINIYVYYSYSYRS